MWERLRGFNWLDGVLVMGLAMVVIGLGINWAEKFNSNSVKAELIKGKITPTAGAPTKPIKITVEVAGEVIKPGVYKLDAGQRVNDALVLVGGLGVKADREWVERNVNRAEVLRDGEKIYIPRANNQETITKKQTITNDQNPITKQILGVKSEIISLNTATLEELDTLSGVGLAIAQRIIDYREKNGGFKNTEEIKLVSGIGDKLFEKIRERISL